MRRIIRTTGLAAAGFVLALGVAAATDRAEQAPESRAYFGFSFGGEKAVPRDFHYGLRVDHDSRFVDGAVPPLMQFDFTRRGLNDARVNGLSVLKQQYRLRQSEEEAAAEASAAEPAGEAAAEGAAEGAAGAAAEEGFFSGLWTGTKNFFGGLFGGGDEAVDVAEEATPAEEAPAEAAPEELADGAFANFGIVDWGLLALGVAGLGLATSEVSGGDEDPSRPGQGGTTGGQTGGQTGGCTTGGVTGQTASPCIPGTPFVARGLLDLHNDDPEYRKWLDGGTGQMGDLGGQ